MRSFDPDTLGLREPNPWDRLVGFRPGRRLIAVAPGASDCACRLLALHAVATSAALHVPGLPKAVTLPMLVLLIAATPLLFAYQLRMLLSAPDRLRTPCVWLKGHIGDAG